MSTGTPSAVVAIGDVQLGPYVTAPAVIHGQALGALDEHLDQVVRTAVTLARRAEAVRAAAELERPLRSYRLTGILSLSSTRNQNRTQIGVDTGQSRFGADQMWTDYQEESAAARTRAILASHVGRRVEATKQTFFEYDACGEVILNEKNERQTRTRLAPGSLYLLSEAGAKTPIDLDAVATAGDAPQRAAGSNIATSPFVPANEAFAWIASRFGHARARAAWGDLSTTGTVERTAFEAVRRRLAGETPREAPAHTVKRRMPE